MKTLSRSLVAAAAVLTCCLTTAHDLTTTTRYLANEGVVVESGDLKIMFDPFFHNDFGTYQLVPESIRTAIFDGKAPYDNIDAVFVSHAHGDHFDAADTIRYLTRHSKVKFYASQQAVTMLQQAEGYNQIKDRVRPIKLAQNEIANQLDQQQIRIHAVRIPHAGWPKNADIENIVFRVQTDDSATITHMGDADTDAAHYKKTGEFWSKHRSDITFLPYWFDLSEKGKLVMKEHLNSERYVGVHVPTELPDYMQHMTIEYLHEPGQEIRIKPVQKESLEPNP